MATLFVRGPDRIGYGWRCSAPVFQSAENAVSNTVQCGFESHPGHPFTAVVGAPPDHRCMYPRALREDAIRLLGQGCTLSAVSRALGVSRSALREWRDSGPEAASALSDCPRCSGDAESLDAPSYSALFGYYLGDGCLSHVRTHFVMRISCDATYPGIIADATRLVAAVHAGGSVCHVHGPGVVVVQNCWKHWPCLFPQHGPGRKHERVLGMTDWQWALVRDHPADFLRGLFHSDGSRVNNWATRPVAGVVKRYEYPRWQFTNCSAEIRQWCCDALDLVGVPWRRSNAKTISVSTRAGVARLDDLIGRKY